MKKITLVAVLAVFCSTMFAQNEALNKLIQQKQFEDVVEQIQLNSSEDSTYVALVTILAQAHEGLLNTKKAHELYTYCYEKDTTNRDMLMHSARTAALIGRVGKATKAFEQLYEKDTTDFYTNYQLARLYQQQEQYTKAQDRLDYLLTKDSTNTTILVQKGDIYMKQNNAGDAISAYYSALLYNPENAALANTVVNILYKLGEAVSYDWAIDICLESLSYNPTDKALRRTLGIGYYSTFKYEKADSVFTTLRAENDKNFITLKYAAASKLKQKQYYDSVEPFAEAFQIDSADVELTVLYATALGYTYDPKRALNLFAYAQTLLLPNPALEFLLNSGLAHTERKLGNRDKAADIYMALYNQYPDQLSLLYQVISTYPELFKDIDRFHQSFDQARKEKLLYALYTYATALRDKGASTTKQKQMNEIISKHIEALFFENKQSITMRNFEGKRIEIPVKKFQDLITNQTDSISQNG